MGFFIEKKRKILTLLSHPEETYIDASPKGSVDRDIRDLVDDINKLDGFVTTSSCAGRIAVYLEGSKTSGNDYDILTDVTSASAGGKGGGQWLFVSHEPVEQRDHASLLALLGLPETQPLLTVPPSDSRYIHLKFEPMILHVLCSSLDDARLMLGAALSAGFRESGISSIDTIHEIAMVAIRTNGLAFDSIIGFTSDETEPVSNLLVSEEYMRTLVEISKTRFEVNISRKNRFAEALMQAVGKKNDAGNGKPAGWEPAEIRRARKRAEGLAKRQQIQQEARHHLFGPELQPALDRSGDGILDLP